MSAKSNKKRMGEGETNKTNEEKRKYLRKENEKGKRKYKGKKWDENDIRVQNKESRRNIQVKNSEAGMNNIFKKY